LLLGLIVWSVRLPKGYPIDWSACARYAWIRARRHLPRTGDAGTLSRL
jgi:hypothetical protein